MKRKILMLILTAFMLSFGFSYDDTSGASNTFKYYDNAKVIKVKYSVGEAFLRRSYDNGAEEAGVNIPIFEKDVAGTNNGRLDIYLGRSNFLRLNNDTEIEFQKLPKLRKTAMTIFLRKGDIYLDLYNLDYEKDIEIQTADCGVFILSRGIYRINFDGVRGTEVFVFDGATEVAGNNYSKIVRDNQKIVMRNGSVSERPFYFSNSDKDDFDTWNQGRHGIANYARSGSSRYLNRGYEDTEYELTRRGRWRYSSTYSTNIWIPYNTGFGWRPYYNGRWVYSPFYGYVWYSYDPWGSFTYHYGRWQWNNFWGWYWIPGYRWSPAWVSWCYSGNYYGWTPLSYYNRPVIVINKRWLRNYKYRNGVPLRSMSTIVVRKNRLSSSIRRVAISGKKLINIKRGTLSHIGRSPAFKPEYRTVKVINSRGQAVIYKKNGLRSGGRYKIDKTYSGSLGVPGTYKKRTFNGNYNGGSKYKFGDDNKGFKSGKSGTSSGYRSKSSTFGGSTTYRKSSGGNSIGVKKSTYKINTKSYKSSSKGKSASGKKSGSSSKKAKKKKYPSYSLNRYGSNNYYSRSYSQKSRTYQPKSRKRYRSYYQKNSYSNSYGNRSSYYGSRTYKYTSPKISYKQNRSYSSGSYKYSTPKRSSYRTSGSSSSYRRSSSSRSYRSSGRSSSTRSYTSHSSGSRSSGSAKKK